MAVDEIFDALTSADNARVKACLSQLRDAPFDPRLLAYVYDLHLFHENAKVRAIADELFKKHAPQDLLEHVAATWEHKYRRHQDNHPRWLHPAIDSAEFMLMRHMTCRNYYAKHPKAGMNVYASRRFGVEIEQVLECWGGKLRTLPGKVTDMQHLAAVAIGLQEALDLNDIVEKLSRLPALNFFMLYKCGIEKLPENFSMLANLQRFELKYAPITALGDHVRLPRLRFLSIAHTGIETLDLANFPALDTLNIEDERRLKTLKFENVARGFLATSGPNGFKVQVEPD